MGSFLLPACEVLAAGLLGLMSYQDWRTRSISWPAFPALGVLLLLAQLLRRPAAVVGGQLLLNCALLAVLLLGLAAYVRWRFRGLGGPRLRDCLGSGDVLYWVVVAGYFSPAGYWAYFLGSCLVALLVAAGTLLCHPAAASAYRVPLAGVQATCLLGLLAGRWLCPAWSDYAPEDYLLTAWNP